jgi:hypothetical protein
VRDSDSRFHSSFSAPNLVHRRIRLKFCTAAGKYFPREVGVQGGKRERERGGGGRGGPGSRAPTSFPMSATSEVSLSHEYASRCLKLAFLVYFGLSFSFGNRCCFF